MSWYRLINSGYHRLFIILCVCYVMPVSSNITTRPKTVTFGIKGQSAGSGKQTNPKQDNQFLRIAPALPILPEAPLPSKLTRHPCNTTSLVESQFNIENDELEGCNAVTLQWKSEGRTVVASRTAAERGRNPDRICLDRRGLTTFPSIIGEPKLRLLSLQHNLLTKIDSGHCSQLTKLVFLDLYDNQIEKLCGLNALENLRVLLTGKNRIKKIEGLKTLCKLEILDLHGNQIVQVSGLEELVSLKVLNLAGNNIKIIGSNDFQGLTALKELNLRRNKIKKLLGFGDTPQLQKLYLSNNDISKIEDMGSLAKALQIREITIDGNPVTLNGDYVSFLVSYLPNLQYLSTMQINENTRRAAMAWRTTKEQCNSAFLDLSTQVCMNVRREEVISNAKINWELFRCRNKSNADSGSSGSNIKSNNTTALHVQKANKYNMLKASSLEKAKTKDFGSLTSINENVEARKIHIKRRSNSSDNLFRLKDTAKANPLEFKLPPILGSIVDSLINDKFDEKLSKYEKAVLSKVKVGSDAESASSSDSDSCESHESLKRGLKSCLLKNNPNKHNISRRFNFMKTEVLDMASKLKNNNQDHGQVVLPKDYERLFKPSDVTLSDNDDMIKLIENAKQIQCQNGQIDCQTKSTASSSGYCSLSSKTSSMDSSKSVLSDSSVSSIGKTVVNKCKESGKDKNRVKSAQMKKVVYYRSNRAATARAKYRTLTPPSPPPPQNPLKEREQGGDYLIEIVGRCLNVYGQGALRFIDRPWDSAKSQDVNVVKFNYVQFNDVAKVLSKLKNRFPNVEHYMFKETNISYLGQLNALTEVQGLTSINIEAGNPIVSKDWKVYAIFRLAHWGLKIINGNEITEEEIESANREYSGLVDIVLCSLPEALLQPLLQRLRLEKVQRQSGEQITAKQFLFRSDPALRSVVAKEALQWRKGSITQEDLIWRHRGKMHLLNLIDLTVDAIQKLQMFEKEWPSILHEIIHRTLLDFSEMDAYMKRCSRTLQNDK